MQKPGKVVFERPATVLEAIMEAGGFTAYGDPKRIAVIRQVNGIRHTQIVDLSPVLHGKPGRVMYVSAGDVIYVGRDLSVSEHFFALELAGFTLPEF